MVIVRRRVLSPYRGRPRVRTLSSLGGCLVLLLIGLQSGVTARATNTPVLTWSIETIAGTGLGGFSGDGGPAQGARFSQILDIARDDAGNLFIADHSNNRVRRIDATSGIITTLAFLIGPRGLAFDPAGHLYVTADNRVLRVDTDTGHLTTVAGAGASGFSGDGGPATSALLSYPEDIVFDSAGNLYIADSDNHRIRMVAPATGVISTVAGTGTLGFGGDGGPALEARLNEPSALALDGSGQLYIGDLSNHRVRVVDLMTSVITTYAGTGLSNFSGEGTAAASASLNRPYRLVIDGHGDLLVADRTDFRVRRVSAVDGRMTTVAGSGDRAVAGDGGAATAASFYDVRGLAIDAEGRIIVADFASIRRVGPPMVPAYMIGTIAGRPTVSGHAGDGGPAAGARLNSPQGLAVDAAGHVYIADTLNHAVRRIDAVTGSMTTVVGDAAHLSSPAGVAVDPDGNVYVSDTGHHTIRRIDAVTGEITTIAGTGTAGSGGDDGPAHLAQFRSPGALAVGVNGSLYIADKGNHRIRRIDLSSNIITAFAGTGVSWFSGDGGPAVEAELSLPEGLAVDRDLNVWIADSHNCLLRYVAATTGVISTVAGAGNCRFEVSGGPAADADLRPTAVTVDVAGNVYIADRNHYRVVKLDVATGRLTAIAGTSDSGYGGDGAVATAAQFAFGPRGIAVTPAGDVLVADTDNHIIRVLVDTVAPPAVVSAPVSQTVAAGANVVFAAQVSGRLPPALQWQSSSDGGATYVNLVEGVGATGTTLSQLTVIAPSLSVNGTRYRLVATNSEGSVISAAAVLTVREPLTAAPGTLRFAARKQGETLTAVTAPQTLTISMGATASAWTVSSDQPWLTLSSTGGTGPGSVTASVSNPADILGTLTSASATITITAPDAPNPTTTVPVFLSIQPVEAPASAPIGRVDSPAQNSTGVQGALAMTGWAVDDIGIDRVRIYRQCLPFDNPAACRTVVGASLVYLGDASVIAGARPDVEAAFPTLPAANAAGWGFLILSNVLPHIPNATPTGGVGTFHLHAVAIDTEGHEKLLGRTAQTSVPTTVTVANDTIAKPFGAIDTPGQGATASGLLHNFGWVLTPDTSAPTTLVPLDGSTITVYIDGASVGTAQYNLCRGSVGNPVPAGILCDDDVSNRFRGDGTRFRNLDAARGPIGLRSIDTTTLSNGLHTISWGVTDSAGRSEGIGSRFFRVLNTGAPDPGTSGRRDLGPSTELRDPGTSEPRNPGTPVFARTGFDVSAAYTALEVDADGVPQVRIPEHGRIELQLPGVVSGVMVANGTVRALPVGVGIDRERGLVTWVAGPGYLGTYRLRFEVPGAGSPEVLGAEAAVDFAVIDITVASASTVGDNVRMRVDRADVHGATFTLHGWALDPQAATGAGIGTVHVWGRRRSPEVPGSRSPDVPTSPVFLGVAQLGVARPDVAAAHGAHMPNAGFVLQGVLPDAGEWEITAYVWVTRTGRFEDARTVTVVR